MDGPSVSGGQTNRLLAFYDGLNLDQRWLWPLGQGHPKGEALRIDSSGQTLIVTDGSDEVGVRVDLKSGTRLPLKGDVYPLALGPGGTNWVAWNRKEGRGLLLFSGEGAIPLVTLGIDVPMEAYCSSTCATCADGWRRWDWAGETVKRRCVHNSSAFLIMPLGAHNSVPRLQTCQEWGHILMSGIVQLSHYPNI